MSIESVLTTKILATPGITALIGSRFHWDVVPQDTALPYVIAINVSDVPEHTHQGEINMRSPMIQFTAYAATKVAAAAVATQIKTALSDYQGTLTDVYVHHTMLANEFSSCDKTADGTQTIFFHDLEYEVCYQK